MGIYGEEHVLFQQSVRRHLEREILPHVTSWETGGHFPDEVFTSLGSQGFLGILVPEMWGGVGGDYELASAWCEEFGRVPSVGMTTGVNMHSLVVLPALARFGTDEVKERFLRPAVRGELIGAYAFTEPGAGSDLTVVQTRAIQEGTTYRLNGSKTFITNGARADFILVLARTEFDKGYEGFTTFVVDTSQPGFQVTRTLDKLGWHASDTAEIAFLDMVLPQEMVLGVHGRGWRQAMESLQWERLMLALGALGGARSCLESTVHYVNDRRVFGQSVGSFDLNRETLARLFARLEAGRALCHRCVTMLNRGERCRREVSLAKLVVCELAIEIADRCVQLHGGYGYTREFLPERWLRDLRLNTIGGGTSEIMTRLAAKEIFGIE